MHVDVIIAGTVKATSGDPSSKNSGFAPEKLFSIIELI